MGKRGLYQAGYLNPNVQDAYICTCTADEKLEIQNPFVKKEVFIRVIVL